MQSYCANMRVICDSRWPAQAFVQFWQFFNWATISGYHKAVPFNPFQIRARQRTFIG
jgi:hypothetical protein